MKKLVWEARALNRFAYLLQNLDLQGILRLLLSGVAVILCMSVHELSHGLVAYKLGDPTAKDMGRLSLNPLRHVDPLGALMLLTVGVGWAKPVSVDTRYFENPKRDMALTALAGPVSNFLLTFLCLLGCSLLLKFPFSGMATLYRFLCYLAVTSLGLGLFNLIPISPLDGSKVLLAFLPENIYWTILRYERYIFYLVIALAFFGAFDGFLTAGIQAVLDLLCKPFGFSGSAILYGAYLL